MEAYMDVLKAASTKELKIFKTGIKAVIAHAMICNRSSRTNHRCNAYQKRKVEIVLHGAACDDPMSNALFARMVLSEFEVKDPMRRMFAGSPKDFFYSQRNI
jgi:hypothetical protein